jgi:hypothetical protein
VGPPGTGGRGSTALTPAQQADARTFLAPAATSLPQGPGEKALPAHRNHEILKGANTRAEVLEVLCRLSEQNEREINEQRRDEK